MNHPPLGMGRTLGVLFLGALLLAGFSGCGAARGPRLLASAGDADTLEVAELPASSHLLPAPTSQHAGTDPFADESTDFLEEEPAQAGEEPRLSDPLKPFNRAMFHVNDKFHFWILKPVAMGYKRVTTPTVRRGVGNFFVNLLTPVRVVSLALQGRPEDAGNQFRRFMLNSTVGVLGFGNPARDYPEMALNSQDLGLTLGRWGAGHGIYLVWPLLGPSSLRDTAGWIGGSFLDPKSYVYPWWVALSIRGVDTVNLATYTMEDYETLKKAALDPYTSLKSAYIELRAEQLSQ